MANRTAIPNSTKVAILTESGYRCAIPTCRAILAIDLHHLIEVSEDGSNDATNLIALCPTCHALHHRGTIPRESLYCYKSMLVSLNNAFDRDAIDKLLFLYHTPRDFLALSGDGVLSFSRLIAGGFVQMQMMANNAWQLVTYQVFLSPKGRLLIDAWVSGDRTQLGTAIEQWTTR